MMDVRKAAELAKLCCARVVGDPAGLVGPEVVIDSRQVTSGALFVALPGEHTDGHRFVSKAIEAGAGAVLVQEEVEVDAPALLVEDVLTAFGKLAGGLVRQAQATGLRCVGVTGSSGKTSTKDLLAQVLAAAGPTVAPVGSFNNEIGVPLTACKIDQQTKFLVSEMGSRGLGHIRELTHIVPVDTAVVLNVGPAHLGEFGSMENVAKAKGELAEAASSWVVLNADDPLVRQMATLATAQVAVFSVTHEPRQGELQVWATDLRADLAQRYSFTVHAQGSFEAEAEVRLQVSGEHQVANACAALAAALCEDVELTHAVAALNQATARSKWRMEMLTRPDGLLVVNDAYNANPSSMRAALTTLAKLRRPGGKLIAVLGDMLELGDSASMAHREVGEYAAEVGVDMLIAVGEQRDYLSAGARRGGLEAVSADKENLVSLVRSSATPADVVLVKASRGLALEAIAERVAEG
jgi:UDP-N-acetylmuramoyl-tripeptide--D-alanyl-D-alanine ligase